MKICRVTWSLVFFLTFSVGVVAAQGTYTQIDVPGALGTLAYAIDTAGDVAGWYADNSGQHGFLLSAGVYSTIDYPGASDTNLFGMNDLGQFVGSANSPFGGFLFNSQAQTFTSISFPGTLSTFPTAINNAGEIAGWVHGTRNQFGFTLAGSTYRRIVPTGAVSSTLSGLASSGKVVGYVFSAGGSYLNFVVQQGKYEHLAIASAPGAVVEGINPSGSALVGFYQPSSGVLAGFMYQNKILTTLQFPGSTQTSAWGINIAGQVVGTFYDASGIPHGFTWTPGP
jgi:probable HAF family extracellular repeat protein